MFQNNSNSYLATKNSRFDKFAFFVSLRIWKMGKKVVGGIPPHISKSSLLSFLLHFPYKKGNKLETTSFVWTVQMSKINIACPSKPKYIHYIKKKIKHFVKFTQYVADNPN